MTELSVLSKTGTFMPLPDEIVAAFDEARRASYAKLAKCAADLKAADDAVAESIGAIKQANAAVIEHEKFIAATLPKREFHDLWRETFKG